MQSHQDGKDNRSQRAQRVKTAQTPDGGHKNDGYCIGVKTPELELLDLWLITCLKRITFIIME